MNRALLDLLCCPYSAGALRLDEVEATGDDVTFGVLHSEAGRFPVIAGVPVLRSGAGGLADRVLAGDLDGATREAAFGEVSPSGWRRMGPWLAATDRLRGLGRRIEGGHRRGIEARAAALTDPAADVEALFALAYGELGLRNPEVRIYNWYRFGVPRHLAALAALAWAPRSGPVLDLGCGAGHLTWALRDHVAADSPVIGVDGLFFALYVAKTRLAPGAEFVCCELESLPFRSGAIGGAWASDVVHALARKAQVGRELERVGTHAGWGAVVGLAVEGHDHEYAGRPLSLHGYRALLPDEATLVADDHLVRGYLERRGADRAAIGDLDAAPTVTALWDRTGTAGDGAVLTTWPHASGTLGLNPLFVADGRTGEGTRVRRRWPSDAYRREHGALADYTAESAEITDASLAAAREGRPDAAIDALVERFVVLGLPPGYRPDPWAGIGPGA